LERIQATGFATLNIDLMYGLPGQTRASWLASLTEAVQFEPEELYLYPLYVRPLTGLDRSSKARARMRADWDAQRLALYRAGRDWLRERGYEQLSMRLFRRLRTVDAPAPPVYRCQDDGMVGLGAGARSYTRALHYSSEYAVGAPTVKSIIQAYIDRPRADHARADYGAVLDSEDRRRRYVLLSLLIRPGLSRESYRRRFGGDVLADMPALSRLAEDGLACIDDERVALTEAGVERSDAIGPWLHSPRVRRLMSEYRLR
jgi:oxygen-independent coproporphyrinogen-3 oxidase